MGNKQATIQQQCPASASSKQIAPLIVASLHPSLTSEQTNASSPSTQPWRPPSLLLQVSEEERNQLNGTIYAYSEEIDDIFQIANPNDHTAFYGDCDYKLKKERWSRLEKALPSEVIFQVLSFLDLKDNLNLSRVSRNFSQVWTAHPLLWAQFKQVSASLLMYSSFRKTNLKFVCENYVKYMKQLTDQFKLLDEMSGTDMIVKFICLGDDHVGKTKWCEAVEGHPYTETYSKTVGVRFYVKNMKHIPTSLTASKTHKPMCRFKVQLWDISDETFQHSNMSSSHFRGVSGIVFCFDLTNETSLKIMDAKMNYFFSMVNQDGSTSDQTNDLLKSCGIPIAIVGFKSDNPHSKRIARRTIGKVLSKYFPPNGILLEQPSDLRIQYFEVSSKEGINIFHPIYFILKNKTSASTLVNTPTVDISNVGHRPSITTLHSPRSPRR